MTIYTIGHEEATMDEFRATPIAAWTEARKRGSKLISFMLTRRLDCQPRAIPLARFDTGNRGHLQMKSESAWVPSKFAMTAKGLAPSRDIAELNPASRVAAVVLCEFYNRVIPGHASGRLLDLGCGKAPLYGVYRQHVSDITCVDWPTGLHGTTYLDLEADLNQDIPLPSASYDTILLSDVLEHIADPEGLWREMNRLLAPNGTLLMNVPYLYWLHEKPHDYYRYTEFALRRFAERNGFEIVELKPLGGGVEVLADITSKLLNRNRFTRLGVKPLQALVGWHYKTRRGTRMAQTTGREFPFQYGLVARKRD